MEKNPVQSQLKNRVHPMNAVFAGIGLIGIGVMIGGWASTNESSAQVMGIAVNSSTNTMYRVYSSGKVEQLNLGGGMRSTGTSSNWQSFSP